MLVAFRVDSSTQIGIGHVMRCLTLADELKQQGAKIKFITRSHHGNISEQISVRGYSVELLKQPDNEKTDDLINKQPDMLGVTWEQDAVDTINSIHDSEPDWMVVDHYNLDYRWHNKLRPYVKKILVIDDLANRKIDCDLLLDQTSGRNKNDYKGLVPSNARLCLGSKYVLLRKEFLENRDKALQRRKNTRGIHRIFVSMGGTDSVNATAKILKVLDLMKWNSYQPDVDVVLGQTSPHLDDIRRISSKLSLKVSVSTNVKNMAQHMIKADLAIGAAGTTTWERCCVGLPSIIIILADNQRMIAREVESAGAAIGASMNDNKESSNLEKIIQKLTKSPDILQKMSKSSFDLVDGLGTPRVIQQMEIA